jgi:YVTN family beta-propeller protein
VKAFISKLEKKYHIYLIIIIVLVIYTSVIVLPYNAVGKTLHSLEIESNSNEQNVPSFNVGRSPEGIAVDDYEGKIAYVANTDSNTVSIIKETDGVYSNVANVTIGDPVSIAVRDSNGIAYVANSYSNTVYIIDYTMNTVKLLDIINVGEGPSHIAVDDYGDYGYDIAYVANSESDSVSVIKETSDGVYSNVANVNVGTRPVSIAVDDIYNIAYVANIYSNTVSIIKETSDGVYSNVANVNVGESPVSIAVNDYDDNIAYVASRDSNTVSVIYGPSQKVQAGVSFDINPFHAGHIECDNITVPTNQYFYVDFRTQCEAKANKGFQFSNWIENLGSNSSRTINASIPTDSPVDWIKSALGLGSKQTSSILTVTKFGNFAANFENLPPAIPSEYLIPLYGVIVSSIVGWSIPSIVGWVKTKKMIRTSNLYHKRISSLYEDNKLDHNDIAHLDKIKIDMSDAYAKGKISDQHYQNLKNEISVLYEEIHSKRIDWLNGKHDIHNGKLLDQIKYDIEDAYAKGKISDQHYNLLNKKIESSETTSDNKTNHDNIGAVT